MHYSHYRVLKRREIVDDKQFAFEVNRSRGYCFDRNAKLWDGATVHSRGFEMSICKGWIYICRHYTEYRGLCFSKVEQGVDEDQSCPSTHKRAMDVLLQLFRRVSSHHRATNRILIETARFIFRHESLGYGMSLAMFRRPISFKNS